MYKKVSTKKQCSGFYQETEEIEQAFRYFLKSITVQTELKFRISQKFSENLVLILITSTIMNVLGSLKFCVPLGIGIEMHFFF